MGQRSISQLAVRVLADNPEIALPSRESVKLPRLTSSLGLTSGREGLTGYLLPDRRVGFRCRPTCPLLNGLLGSGEDLNSRDLTQRKCGADANRRTLRFTRNEDVDDMAAWLSDCGVEHAFVPAWPEQFGHDPNAAVDRRKGAEPGGASMNRGGQEEYPHHTSAQNSHGIHRPSGAPTERNRVNPKVSLCRVAGGLTARR